jgi:hypothetical protein
VTASENPKPKRRKAAKLCKCGAPAAELHPCPYDAEMAAGDEEAESNITQCNCCNECTAKCAEEV